MADIGRSRGVRGGADARLVREETALNAVHDTGTGEAAEDGLHVESLGKDAGKDRRYQIDMHDRHQQGDQDIKAAHNRHKGRGNLDDTLASAEDAVTHQHRENRADHPGGNGGIIKAVDAEGGLQVIGGKHIEAAGVGKQQTDAEQHGQRTVVQGRFDVIGGAAVAAALGISLYYRSGQECSR